MIRWMAWRLHRRGLIGFGGGGLLLSFFYGLAFLQAAGTTPESRAEFGRVSYLAAKEFTFLIPPPVHPETLGGYEQYKWLSGAIVMMMIWATLAGVGVGRGDEERGLTGEWIAAGVSRTRLLLARSAAFLSVVTLACLGAVMGIVLVAPIVQQDTNLGGELLKALSMIAGIFFGYGLALFISQLPAERQTATALAVGAVVVLLVVNGVADSVDSVRWIAVVSPFHWVEQTTSAAPGGTFDAAATVGLAAAGLALVAGALAAFRVRDIGSGLVSFGRRSAAPVRAASHNLLLRRPFTMGLWEQRVGLATWVVGTMVLGALMTSVVRSVTDALFSAPEIKALFAKVMTGPPYSAFLGFFWFGIALLLLAGYAIVQVSRWSNQDQEGRVEMLLSAPVSRAGVIVERALEFAAASLLIVAGGYIGVALEVPAAGLDIDPGRVLGASALLWPFALAFGGLGVAVASRWPRVAVPLLSAFVAVEYFLGDLGPLFRLPDWVSNLSVFHLYGNPLVGAASVSPVAWMTLVFLGGFVAAMVLMMRRDVAGG